MYLFKEYLILGLVNYIYLRRVFMTAEVWIAVVALVFSAASILIGLYSLYNQFHKIELVAYPTIRDHEVYLVLENTGETLVKDFTVNVENKGYQTEKGQKILDEMPFLNGKASFTLASGKKREIPLGSYLQYAFDNKTEGTGLPIFEVTFCAKKPITNSLYRVTYTCDYNAYSNESIVYSNNFHFRRMDDSLRGIESGIKNEEERL